MLISQTRPNRHRRVQKRTRYLPQQTQDLRQYLWVASMCEHDLRFGIHERLENKVCKMAHYIIQIRFILSFFRMCTLTNREKCFPKVGSNEIDASLGQCKIPTQYNHTFISYEHSAVPPQEDGRVLVTFLFPTKVQFKAEINDFKAKTYGTQKKTVKLATKNDFKYTFI